MGTQSSENSRSSETTKKRSNGRTTTAHANTTESSAKTKSSNHSAKKASNRKKPGAARVSASSVKGGRPLLFPDRTICRLPAGTLKTLGAIAKRKGISQGEAVRNAVGLYIAHEKGRPAA